MTIRVSAPALFILQTLQTAGYEAYLVGGAVRDLLLVDDPEVPARPQASPDYDFTTNALPEQIQGLFPEHFYENTFGTVSVAHQHLLEQMKLPADFIPLPPAEPQRAHRLIDAAQATKLHVSLQLEEASPVETVTTEFPAYQITTFRSDEVYDDFRRPSSMTWGSSLQEDLERRDFTMNALAIQVSAETLTTCFQQLEPFYELNDSQYTLVDRFGGITDLTNHQIKTVGEPDRRFTEDALRILRAIRFAVQLNMAIDDATFASLQKHAPLLAHISAERLRDELTKMLGSAFPAEAIELLDEAGALEYCIPELLAAKGVEQGGHHTTDVWTHSLDALRTCPSSDPVVRLATLLHDIAKPQTFARQKNTITFYNHEVIGARVASAIARRLRLSKHDVQRVFTLVRFHMFYYQPTMTDAAVRRFMRNVGLENIDDILDLREGDRLGSGARKTSWRLEEFKDRMMEQLHQPMDVKDLAVNGHDLMTELGLQPGPMLGKTLQYLFEQVLEDPELNTKETLLSRAKAFSELDGVATKL